jgi:hypothetical protein
LLGLVHVQSPKNNGSPVKGINVFAFRLYKDSDFSTRFFFTQTNFFGNAMGFCFRKKRFAPKEGEHVRGIRI